MCNSDSSSLRDYVRVISTPIINCFITQIVPDSLQLRFRSVKFCGFGFSFWNFSNMAPHTWQSAFLRYEPQSRSARLWLGVKPVDATNYRVRFAPDARRHLQKSQNGIDADQDHAIPRRANVICVRLHTRKLTRRPRTV